MKYRDFLNIAGLIVTLVLIIAFGWLLKLTIGFYMAVYPEAYSRAIVGRLSRPEDISAVKKIVYIAQETWPVIAAMSILGIIVLALITAFATTIKTEFSRRKSIPEQSSCLDSKAEG